MLLCPKCRQVCDARVFVRVKGNKLFRAQTLLVAVDMSKRLFFFHKISSSVESHGFELCGYREISLSHVCARALELPPLHSYSCIHRRACTIKTFSTLTSDVGRVAVGAALKTRIMLPLLRGRNCIDAKARSCITIFCARSAI